VDDFREERRARGAAGRQARPSGQGPDLTRVKSDKKERARHAPTDASEPHHALSRQGRRGGCDGGGGRGWIGERKVNARRQPLDFKRPGSCPAAGGASFAQPRSPRPRPPPLPEIRRNGQRLPQTTPHKGYPMPFRRLPWPAISVPDSCDALPDACFTAWNRFASDPETVTSLTGRSSAQGS
jgi:hypothetical protein